MVTHAVAADRLRPLEATLERPLPTLPKNGARESDACGHLSTRGSVHHGRFGAATPSPMQWPMLLILSASQRAGSHLLYSHHYGIRLKARKIRDPDVILLVLKYTRTIHLTRTVRPTLDRGASIGSL